ncbi:unnamed protein product, partial [Amoebophrya sp. A25]|eukprot:GSA25T00014810001.1
MDYSLIKGLGAGVIGRKENNEQSREDSCDWYERNALTEGEVEELEELILDSCRHYRRDSTGTIVPDYESGRFLKATEGGMLSPYDLVDTPVRTGVQPDGYLWWQMSSESLFGDVQKSTSAEASISSSTSSKIDQNKMTSTTRASTGGPSTGATSISASTTNSLTASSFNTVANNKSRPAPDTRTSSSLPSPSPCTGTIAVRCFFLGGNDADGEFYEGRAENFFLPKNAQGLCLLELFRVAFRRRLLYKLGIREATKQYAPCFHIPLKTKAKGGGRFGWPDNPALYNDTSSYFLTALRKLEADGVSCRDLDAWSGTEDLRYRLQKETGGPGPGVIQQQQQQQQQGLMAMKGQQQLQQQDI